MARAPEFSGAPVPFGIRDQQTTPQGRARPLTPNIRPLTGGNSGIGESLGQLAQATRAVQQAELQVDENELRVDEAIRQQEEEDGRTYASAALARIRADASKARRSAFAEAQDGWRGATERVATDFATIRDGALTAAPTDAARRFITEAAAAYEPAFLEDVADEQQRARRSWRVDTVRSAVQTESATLAADPNLWDEAYAQQVELIRGMTDLDADARRDLETEMQEEFAVTTVGALVQRNPAATLRLLRDPESDGPFQHLTGRQRTQFINQAQSEIDRRNSEYRANLRTQIEAARDLWTLGEQAPNAPSVESVRSAFGDNAAAAYAIQMEANNAASLMNGMSSAELATIAATAPSQGTDSERFESAARRAAASQILERRQTDPMADYARAGSIDTEGMAQAIQSGDFAQIGQRLQTRASIAQQNSETRGTRPAPLTNGEAAALRGTLDRLTPQQRTAALQAMGIGNGRGVSAGARAALNQIYADDPASRMGAMLMGRAGSVAGVNGRVGGDTAARRMLHGAAILNPPEGANQEGNERPQVDMPSDAALRAAWRDVVGDAYAGSPEMDAQAYQAFRAYFAGAAAEMGVNAAELVVNGSPAPVRRLATEAARVAAGEIRSNRDGTRTILPWGMSNDSFTRGLQSGWGAIQEAYPNSDISRRSSADFDYQFERSDGRHAYYRVMDRGAQATGSEGQPVVVKVPLGAR